MIQRYRSIVKISYTLLLLLIPFIKIDGESALRFDVPTLKLFIFGITLDINNFFIVLILTFLITFIFIVATQIYGRVWCGWLCPQTVIVDFTRFIDFMGKKPVINKLINYLIVLIMSAVIAANMVWYFVSPYDFFSSLLNGDMHSVTMGFWVVLTIITFLNFAFLRHTFCKTVCPYAKLQSILYDDHTMIVAMNPETEDECIGCNQCVKVCPVDIDIGKGENSACIMCAECIDACAKVMKQYSGHDSLIKYSYGDQDIKKPFRLPVIITSFITLAFMIIFVFLVATMKPFEFEIYPNQKFAPRQTGKNVINSYNMVIHNKSKQNLTIKLSIDGYEGYVIQPSNTVTVNAADNLKETLFLLLPEQHVEKRPILRMNMIATDQNNVNIESELSFRRPFKRKKKQ